ncbi:MAG TPA: FtsQ-type POTRA domain-containing protein [Gemmatimonadales bacterium]|nr:FtsQ-type POTRA domain-containing protein [Gemmatimonadales bacterium]
MAASRLSRPGWKLLGGLGAAAILWFAVPPLLRDVDFFRLRKVDVRGAVNLRPEEIVRDLPIRPGQSLFDDLAPVQAAADTISGLAEVRIGRRLPGTLVVKVREMSPVALAMSRGRLAPVAADGRILPFDPVVAAPDLPVIGVADSGVAGLLARLRETDAGFFGRVVSAREDGSDVVIYTEHRRYRFRPDAGGEVIRAVMAVEQDLERHDKQWVELDARFAGQVVVRWGAA